MRIEVRSLITVLAVVLFFHFGPWKAAWAQAGWKKDWEGSVQAAKKEGQVNAYICGICYNYEAVLEVFSRKYPEIKTVWVSGAGNQMGSRILAERRAGKYLADVFLGGANTNFNMLYRGKALDPLKPAFVLPEVADEAKWFEGRHRFTDPEGKHILGFIASPGSVYYNSKLIDPKEFSSYRDFLHPRWKGKIVSLAPSDFGVGALLQFMYYHPALGPDFIRKFFGGMEMTFSRDNRQMTDWLGSGKFAICVGCRGTDRARRQGLPVGSFDDSGWKEGGYFTVGGGSLSLINNAPHPHAARVFANWFLSREGQMAAQKLLNPDSPPSSLRLDVPKNEIPEENRLIVGGSYFDVTRPEYADMAPIFKLVREVVEARGGSPK